MTTKAILASALAAGLLPIAAPSQAGTLGVSVVFASHRSDYGDTFRIGRERGYHEGLEHGAKDARRNRGFDFAHSGDYRHGDHGYRRHFGPRHVYAAGFRDGYADGYRRGYRTTIAHRHRHHGRSDWCYDRHDRRDDDRYDRRSDDNGRYDRDDDGYDDRRRDRDDDRYDPR